MREQRSRSFDPTQCDLCGSTECNVVLDLPHASLTSDYHIVPEGLLKLECSSCKLIRNGSVYDEDRLSSHYAAYTTGQQATIAEPLFYTSDGVVPRSKIIFEWMSSMLASIEFSNPGSIVEIGCGEGSLLRRFADQWKHASVTGFDMSEASINHLRSRGLQGHAGTYQDVQGLHDLIYSFAVIEHVPSAFDFLCTLKSRLKPGGVLLVSQPCQDHGSNDIYFNDHLHHFFSRHVSELGRRAGLVELARSVNHSYIPDFSMHLFSNRSGSSEVASINETNHDVRNVIRSWNDLFSGVDRWLESLGNRKLAVWGLGQTFRMICAYTRLKDCPIALGFDDNPKRFAQEGYSFPIVPFGQVQTTEPSSIKTLLTFKPNPQVIRRLHESEFDFYAPLIYL